MNTENKNSRAWTLFKKIPHDKFFATKEYIHQKLFESLPHQEKPYQVINIPNLTWLTHTQIRNKATTKPTNLAFYHYQSIPLSSGNIHSLDNTSDL